MTYVLSLLLVLGGLVYLPGISGPFLFDDQPNILSNAFIHILSLDLKSLHHAAFSSESGPLNRPIAMLTFALNYYFSPDFQSTTGFKATNLAIHIGNSLLTFWMLRLILLRLAQSNPNTWINSTNTRTLLAGAVAFLWLIHPIQLTTVLYVVQRMASLAALFTFLGIICYLKGRIWVLSGRSAGFWLMSLGPIAFGILGLYSKETAILLPVFVLLLELFLFGNERPWSFWKQLTKRTQRILTALITLVAIAGFFGAISYALPGYENRYFSLGERLLTETRVLCFYLSLILVPRIDQFGLYHDDIALSTSLLTPWTTLPSLLAIAVLLVTAATLRKQHPLLSLGILWFFAAHLLESSIFPLEIAHEHRNYIASIGVLLIVGQLVAQGACKLGNRRLWLLLPLFAVVFGAVTLLRSSQWSSFNSLAYYEARNHPNSPSALANLAVALYGQKQYTGAIQALRRASDLSEHEQLYLMNMHLLSARTGIPLKPEDEAEVIRRFSLYRFSPSSSLTFETINRCILSECRSLQRPVERWITELLKSLPASADRSFYYHILGRALAGQGKTAEALNAFRQSHALDPNYLHPLFEIVRIYTNKLKDAENADRALAQLRNANIGNRYPRNEEIEAIARDVEKLMSHTKPERPQAHK